MLILLVNNKFLLRRKIKLCFFQNYDFKKYSKILSEFFLKIEVILFLVKKNVSPLYLLSLLFHCLKLIFPKKEIY